MSAILTMTMEKSSQNGSSAVYTPKHPEGAPTGTDAIRTLRIQARALRSMTGEVPETLAVVVFPVGQEESEMLAISSTLEPVETTDTDEPLKVISESAEIMADYRDSPLFGETVLSLGMDPTAEVCVPSRVEDLYPERWDGSLL